MLDRRTLISGLGAWPLLAGVVPVALRAAESQSPLRKIPIGSRKVTSVGLGTSRRYNDPQGEAEMAALRASIARFAELGGQLIDTAPNYGRADKVLGEIIAGLRLRPKLFLATKVSVDDEAAGKKQIEQSFLNLQTDVIDLMQVHNLRDTDAELAALRQLKSDGRIRFLGITTSFKNQYAEFEQVMQREKLDTIQIDYAIDNRSAADRILPLAREKGIAVLVNLPFGRERLFNATAGKPLPDWADEIGATSWAQIFLKYIQSHPSRPIPIPGMAQVRYVDDNLAAARGRLPDAALRRRMEQTIDAL